MAASRPPWDDVSGDHPYLVDRVLLDRVSNEVSGERTWDLACQITRFDRVRGGGYGSGYEECVEWLASVLRELGADDVKIHRFKADGYQKYFQWLSLTGWRVKDAELWVDEPRRELVNRYSEQPTCLMHYSKGGAFSSELVYVGKGKKDADYEGKDVKGKVVLATGGDGYKVHREAVLKRGALGVIVGPSDRGDRLRYPDLIEVYRLSPTGDEVGKVGFGFAISKRQERTLLKLVQDGKKVVISGVVDAEIIPGTMPVLEANLRGTEKEAKEIIVVGHLDHYKPGANDNASGSAGMVEILRNIKSLVGRGVIDPPKKTVKFLWVPELHGALAYLWKNQHIGDKAIACMNLDMIGEDAALCEATFNLTQAPYSTPNYVNDVMSNLLPWLDEEVFFSPKGTRLRFNYRLKPYSGGSDHYMFCDPLFKIPALMLGHRNVFHHTNMDTMATCDATELKRIIGLAEATILYLAKAGDAEAVTIVGETFSKALVRLSERSRRSQLLLNQAAWGKDAKLAEVYMNVREYPKLQAQLESNNISKTLELTEDKAIGELVTVHMDELRKRAEYEMEYIDLAYKSLKQFCISEKVDEIRMELYQRAEKITPIRLFEGPLNSDYDRQRYVWDEIRAQAGDERADWYKKYEALAGGSREAKVFEICNLMDGKLSLMEIRHIVSIEYDETDVEFVIRLYEDLKNIGFVAEA